MVNSFSQIGQTMIVLSPGFNFLTTSNITAIACSIFSRFVSSLFGITIDYSFNKELLLKHL